MSKLEEWCQHSHNLMRTSSMGKDLMKKSIDKKL